jgi:hypothetical protein
MTIYYVNKSGNNANNGLSEVNAKLTISAAISIASSNDTIIVGSGEYAERLSWSDKSLEFQSDGIVYMNGASLGGSGSAVSVSRVSSTANINITFTQFSSSGRWIFKNHTRSSSTIGMFTGSGTTGGSPHSYIFNLYYCDLTGHSTNNQVGLSANAGSSITINYNVYYCTFKDFTTNAILNTSSGGSCVATNCTFYNCGDAIKFPLSFAAKNIFLSNTRGLNLGSTPAAGVLNDNQYYNNTYFARFNVTDYNVWATYQATGVEALGSDADPGVIDAANNIMFLNSTNSRGAWPYSSYTIVRANDFQPDSTWNVTASSSGAGTGWYNSSGNIKLTGDDLELFSGTVETAASVVFDTGENDTQMMEVDLEFDFTWPTNMIDYETSDVRPNYQTIEVRASNTSFNQTDSSPSWTVFPIDSPITGISGRYQQVRLTFRNNDVAG